MSGLPWFRYIDRNTVVIADERQISYTDLEFTLAGGKVEGIQSHFKRILTDLTTDQDFRDTVATFTTFPFKPSFYVNRARDDVMRTAFGRTPIGATDLKLVEVSFHYFDRPQCVEVTFEQISTIQRTEFEKSATTFSRKLNADGKVISDIEAEQGGRGHGSPAAGSISPHR